MKDSDAPILLFDGVCNLCNASVNKLLQWDKREALKFCSLQSEKGKELLIKYSLNHKYIDSIVWIESDKVYLKFNAAIEITKYLGFPFNLLQIARVLPKSIQDRLYDWVAKNRYKWFGKQEQCMVPNDDLKDRFIDSL